jgi:hypothetical protein
MVATLHLLSLHFPAAGHDPNDYEIGKRVGLDTINIMINIMKSELCVCIISLRAIASADCMAPVANSA